MPINKKKKEQDDLFNTVNNFDVMPPEVAAYVSDTSPVRQKDSSFKDLVDSAQMEVDRIDSEPKPSIPESKEEKKDKQEVYRVPQLPPRKAIESLQSRIDKLPVTEVDKAKFENKLDKIENWYNQEKDRLDKAELIESLGQAFTQLGAGLYGAKHGVDMSGLQFQKKDWGRKMDRLLDQFKERKRAVAGEQVAEEQAVKEKRREAIDTARADQAADIRAEDQRMRDLAETRQLEEQGRRQQLSLDTQLAKMMENQTATEKKQTQQAAKEALKAYNLKLKDAQKTLANNKLTDEEKADKLIVDLQIEDMTADEVLDQIQSGGFLGMWKDIEANKAMQFVMGRLGKSAPQQKSINPDVQDYANQYFNGDYQAAENYLKQQGQL